MTVEQAAQPFLCATLRCRMQGIHCARRWHKANVEDQVAWRGTACVRCPEGQARAVELLDVPPARPERRRRRCEGPGRGKCIPWDTLPDGMVLGRLTDAEIARRLTAHVPGGVTESAVRSARYTRRIARFRPPQVPAADVRHVASPSLGGA